MPWASAITHLLRPPHTHPLPHALPHPFPHPHPTPRRAAMLRPGDPRMWCALGQCYESSDLNSPQVGRGGGGGVAGGDDGR